MTCNTKPVWKFIKSLRHSSTGVLSLNTLNGTATSTIDKADALSNQFQSVFTKEDCWNLPTLNSLPTKSMLAIQISTEGIVKLLKELKLQKAPGPDCITATILKTCAEQVAPLQQQIFQKSLDTGELPLNWQKANVVVVVVDPTPPTCCQQSPAPEIMWQPAVSPPRWQGKAPLCRDSSRGPG